MTNCPDCGYGLIDNGNVCSHCGWVTPPAPGCEAKVDGLFNLNEYVSVKLTRDGINRFYQWYEEAGLVSEGPKIDADGWTQFQLWNLMQIFGPVMSIASPLLFETEMKIHGIQPHNQGLGRNQSGDSA